MDKDAAANQKFYGEEELAALIRSLDREEDYHIFAEDVLKTYPYLANSYTKVCPRRCDLGTAAQKALDGAYASDVKLTELKADIALMVSNCVAYNGPTSAYAETAAKFERFALDQIDAFIVEHNGGRRVSRLRLPTPTGSQQQQQTSTSTPQTTSPAAASKGRKAPVEVVAVPSAREMAQLVDSLNRREDGGAFAVNVAEAYPDLREAYEKVCPHPMNLVLMHQRAKEGYYTATAAQKENPKPLYGSTVAASFPRLRDDVELLVRNCITFNAKVESWVTLARSFQDFAHRRIDDLVLRHAAALRGTQTGAELYGAAGRNNNANDDSQDKNRNRTQAAAATVVSQVTTTSTNTSAAPANSATALPPGTPSSMAAAEVSDSRKRDRAEPRGGATSHKSVRFAPAVPSVSVVSEVTPQVCPTPLQPSLEIPPRLRRRLALEHLRHAELPLRRVGVTLPHEHLYPSPTSTKTDEPEDDDGSTKDAPSPSPQSEDAPPAPSAVRVTIDASCTAGHVLRLLREAVENFFAHQRSRSDFADTFAFSQREEQLYLAVLHIVAQQFARTLTHLLLYERESAEMGEWVALQALQLSRGENDESGAAAAAGDGKVVDHVHYLYLVRFLVQWPQLASLCCTSTTAAVKGGAGNAPGAAQASLRISREQVKAMAQVALITQEFLNFIEKIDEQNGHL